VADCTITRELLKLATVAKDVRDKSPPTNCVEPVPIATHYAGTLLPPMLKGVEPEIGEVCRLGVTPDPD